jgi:type VI secretion system protein ImpH
VIQRLLENPQQFSFFSAVRLLDHWLGDAATGRSGVNRIRFKNTLALSFAPSEIESLEVRTTVDATAMSSVAAGPGSTPAMPALAGLQPALIDRVEMTPAFMGLLGASGTLPLYYTESILAHHLNHRDLAPRAFMDVFTHRAVSLFYEAWRKHRLALQYERSAERGFLPAVLSLGGLGPLAAKDRTPNPEARESLAFYAAASQQRAVSAWRLSAILSERFGVQVKVQQFRGRWCSLPQSERPVLGEAHQGLRLGKTALLGERVWQRDLKVRVVLGPLSGAEHARFLPGSSGVKALGHMLHALSGTHLEYELQLLLKKESVTSTALMSSRPATQGRLGWDTFLTTRRSERDRSDVCFGLSLV